MSSFSTSIVFIFIPYPYKNSMVNLQFAKISHIFSGYVDSEEIMIPEKTFRNNESYIEVFELIKKKDEKEKEESFYNFQMTIYQGIVNHIYYDCVQENMATLEMIFFCKNPLILPSEINYEDIDLYKFDTNGNIYRKRICLANIDPSKLKYLNGDLQKTKYLFYNDSFQVILRYTHYNDIQYSISSFKIKTILENISLEEKITITEEDVQNIKIFYTYYSNFLNSLFDIKSGDFTQKLLEISFNKLESIKNVYDKITEKRLFEYLLQNQNVPNSLELINYDYFLSQYFSIYNKGNSITNFFSFQKKIKENNIIHQKFFEKIRKDKNLEENEKIKLLQTCSIISNKAILSKNINFDIDYIKIEIANKNNPYYKAIELVKKIIDNLEENSRLFEAFLCFDSGTIENYLEKIQETNYYYKDSLNQKKKVKSRKYKSEFGLSLLNVNQVKSHLKKLIPKLIIRIESNIKFRAYYEQTTNIMIINELIMFQQTIESLNVLYKEKDSDKFIIPIVMEVFHEMMSHGKVRLVYKNESSPRYYRDSKYNFQYRSIKKNCETEEGKFEYLPIPESGRVLENFISENNSVINSLKSPSVGNIILLDYKYWIGPNFDDLEKQILKNRINKNENENIILNDELADSDFDDCYIERENVINI